MEILVGVLGAVAIIGLTTLLLDFSNRIKTLEVNTGERLSSLEKNTLKSGDFYVDKLKRVFARNLEYVPRKRGRLLGSKNKKKRGDFGLNERITAIPSLLVHEKRKRGRPRKDAVV